MPTLKEKIETILDLIKIGSVIGAAVAAMLTVIGAGIWSLWGERAVATMRAALVIDEDIAEIREIVSENRELILRALGEDRVIHQPAGLSYVVEPVRVGDDVEMILTVGRTSRGESCTFKDGQALFSDIRGFVRASPDRVAPKRQIGDDIERVSVSVALPDNLIPGRVTVWLSLQYDCDGQAVADETYPMPFKLLD